MEEIAVISPGTEAAPATETPTEAPETPTPETPEGETPAAGGEETPAEGADDEPLPGEPEDEPIETDGRQLDAKTREIISKLKKTDPVAAKALADQFYRRQAYEKEFPTVQDARQAKATLEALGGEEGITDLQNELSDYRKEIQQFADGDPELIESLYKNPEALARTIGNAVDVFAKNNNMQALRATLLPHMVKEMTEGPLTASLLKAAKFLEEGKGQEAYDTLGAIGNWLTKLKGDVEKMGTERKQVDPREKQYQEREQRLAEQEKEHADRTLSNEITKLNDVAMAKVLDPFFKELKFSAEGKREFAQQVLKKAWALMKADKVYVRNAQNKRAREGGEAAAKFIHQKFAEVLPIAFRNHKNLMYPNLAKAAAQARNGKPATPAARTPAKPAAAATNGQAIQVKEAPKFEEVDWTKTNDMAWAKGFAHLKNGKYVYFH